MFHFILENENDAGPTEGCHRRSTTTASTIGSTVTEATEANNGNSKLPDRIKPKNIPGSDPQAVAMIQTSVVRYNTSLQQSLRTKI